MLARETAKTRSILRDFVVQRLCERKVRQRNLDSDSVAILVYEPGAEIAQHTNVTHGELISF